MINHDLTDENSSISDSLIDRLIQKIIVYENKFVFKINCGNDNDEDILLTKLVITKYNVKEYERNHSQYKRLRLKEPIVVDVFI